MMCSGVRGDLRSQSEGTSSLAEDRLVSAASSILRYCKTSRMGSIRCHEKEDLSQYGHFPGPADCDSAT